MHISTAHCKIERRIDRKIESTASPKKSLRHAFQTEALDLGRREAFVVLGLVLRRGLGRASPWRLGVAGSGRVEARVEADCRR